MSKHFWPLALVATILGAFPASLCAGERLYFNDLAAPESLDDLAQIESALKSALSDTRAATVCLDLGEEKGSGSGVIISPDGIILTAAHVSGGVGESFEAVMEDGTRYPALSLGLLSDTDAAMVKIEGEGPFPFVEIERSNGTRLGDWVMALGHSGGFDSERGIVVRLGRVVRMAQHTWQTDATLIGGDSGGPLFNLHGELIAIHSRVGKNKVENSHVPMSEYLDNWEKLQAGEFVGEGPFAQRPPGFLGVQLEEGEDGVLIEEVLEGKAAELAGLQAGDILQKVGDEEVKTIEEVQAAISKNPAGRKVTLTYQRDDEEKTIEIELGKN